MVLSDHQFVLCKAALIFTLTRWLLSFALNLLTHSSTSCCSSSSSPLPNLRSMAKNLSLTTLEKIENRMSENGDVSCAICLNTLRKKSQVWELNNCSHVFHKQCLDRWILYDKRVTCPLCRASLVSSPPPVAQAEPPSWAVERMLYLFGDDLLP